MDLPDRSDEAPPEPLALLVTLVELAGAGLSMWYLYRLLRQDPDFEAWRAKVGARLREIGAQRRFARSSTVVPEAEYILSEAQK